VSLIPAGWGNGLLGVIIFSGSLPATRVGVADFSPMFLTSARAAIAAVLGAAFLFVLGQPRPSRADMVPLAIVAVGVVVGFPLFTALALQHITSAHSIVYIGLLPLSTAIFGVLRGGERPRPAFWIFSVIGAAAVAGFALHSSDSASVTGDLMMVAAILLCGLGYAEGATLSRRLGGWQVISWALLMSLPPMAAIALATMPISWSGVGAPAWVALAYVSVFSMLVGFIFWYRGLAQGGIAVVGQLQLLQPFFGLMLAALLLHESVAWGMIASTAIVVLCVAGAKRFA
jgi:drug/metabolite transporter (DMT)-like permease